MRRAHITLVVCCLAIAAWAQNPDNRLTGTPISSPCVNYGSGDQIAAYAFDGNPDTYYASQERSNTWVGLDLGKRHVITHVGWMGRKGYEQRAVLGVFEGSNRPDFLDALPLYIIPSRGPQGEMTVAATNNTVGFRYVRYVGPNDQRCNIAEVAFWGAEGEGDSTRYYQATMLPTVSIHTYSGREPQDKVNELESNITITYDNGTRLQEYPILIRGRGNASWGMPKKPYRIKFNDGKKHHMLKDSPQESPAKAKKWTLINNYGDKTLMRNLLAHEVSRRLDLPYTVYSQAVDVILNGEYKGCYQLCDQITVDKHRVNITEMETTDEYEPELTGGYLIELDAYAYQETSKFTSAHNIPVTIKSPDENDITTNQHNYIANRFNAFEQELWKTGYEDPETGYQRYLNLDSFLRHFLLGEFSGNTDTYYSTYMYKERNEERFTVSPGWDFDLAFENDSRTYPICSLTNWICLTKGSHAGNSQSMVKRILNDPNADKLLKKIWRTARNKGLISEESMLAYTDSLANVIEASAALNFTRWPILNQTVHMNFRALGSYRAEVNAVRDYIKDRIQWVDEFLGYTEGDIYEDSTMYISTPNELIQFAEWVNHGGNASTGILTANIDMSNTAMPMIGQGLKPFKGTFDGQGHTISNLHIEGTNNVGLFGTVSNGANIHDLILDKTCRIDGQNYVGIVGCAVDGGSITLNRVGNEATISGIKNVGGLLGCNMGSQSYILITNCYNAGTIAGENESGALSGWVGNSYDINGCWNCGEVTGADAGRELFRFGGFDKQLRNFSTVGNQGTIVSAEAARSGELCWLLNDGRTDNATWFQRIGEDEHPVFDFYHGIVYFENGTYTNGSFKLGDANADGNIDAADLATIANQILGRAPEGINLTNADPNCDGQIDVYDMVIVGGLIKGKGILAATTATQDATITAADATIKANVVKRYSTMLQSQTKQTIFQADILLPEGLDINPEALGRGASLTTEHILDIAPIEGGYRIVAYAPTMGDFTSTNATAFVLKLTADETFTEGKLTIANQLLATANNVQSRPKDVAYTFTLVPDPSAIEIVNDEDANTPCHELSGIRADLIRRGHVYIIGGKRVIIK